MQRSSVWITILLITITGCVSLTPTDWWKIHYLQGVYAVKSETGDLKFAEKELLAAIAYESREIENQIRTEGGFREDYIPHFYLGRAYAGLGDCEAARREFAESAKYGLSTKYAQLRRIIQTNDGCHCTCPKPINQ